MADVLPAVELPWLCFQTPVRNAFSSKKERKAPCNPKIDSVSALTRDNSHDLVLLKNELGISLLAHHCSTLVDAAPAPVDALDAFPGSSAEGWHAMVLSGLDAQGCFSPNLGCFVVRHDEKLVLCDAGIGPGPNGYLGGLRGDLLGQLASVGISPSDISAVVFTHLHMDHIGWATTVDAHGRRVATFPAADYFVAKAELDYWAEGASGARAHHREAFETIFRPLAALGRIVPVPYGAPIVPRVSLMATPGHTPGHASICFTLGDEKLVIAGDIFHCPGQVERPEWGHRADMDPVMARATRSAFIEQAASENWLIAAGHFRDGLQLGTIVPQGDRRRFMPVEAAMAPNAIFI